MQRLHIELDKLLGVVTEFQQQLATNGDDGELMPASADDVEPVPTAVIHSYVKEIHRIVSELSETNFDDADGCV